MRIAVIGGTGLAGKHTVEAVTRAGHAVVVVSRARGVDIISGRGLDEALVGVDTVIDVSSVQTPDAAATIEFFTTATRNLLRAEQRAKVSHHLLLSIVGIDRVDGNAHFRAKRAQEQLLDSSPIPITIQRATQFHEFVDSVLSWTRQADVAYVPPLLLQPIAAGDVGAVLAEVAVGPPRGRATDLAGPEPQDLVDMSRRLLAARGESLRLVPSWRTPLAGPELAGEWFLPGPDARLASTTFDTWLATQKRR